MKKSFSLLVFLAISSILPCFSQIRVAVLPFQNMDGDLSLNVLSYKLQDSIANFLQTIDPEKKKFTIISSDSIDFFVSQYNLDPLNPQYPTDIWKVVKELKVNAVISGTFNRRADRILINAYIYDVETKLPYPDHQARNIFKSEENVMEAVEIILKKLLPALVE